MFVRCASVLTLLALSANVTKACRNKGILVGFLGPKGVRLELTIPGPASAIWASALQLDGDGTALVPAQKSLTSKLKVVSIARL